MDSLVIRKRLLDTNKHKRKVYQLSFHIIPSPESNDHQVRILVDGNDFLGDDYLGLDPPAFFAQNIGQNGPIIIGRCTCGCEGCGDYPVTVVADNEIISWTDLRGLNLIFEKTTYLNSYKQAVQDHSWEDIKRTVERLINDILRHTTMAGNYQFDWASARIKKQIIILSYSNKDGDQNLFEIPWDGHTEQSAITQASAFKSCNSV